MAGVGGRDPEAGEQGVEVHRHDHGGGGAAVPREPGRVEVLEQGAERVPEAGRVGHSSRSPPCGRGRAVVVVPSVRAGVGPRVQVGQQPVRGGVGDPDPDRRGPVAVRAGGQGGGPAGVAFLVLEPAALVVLADLGGDDVEDPATQDPQLARREASPRARPAPAPPSAATSAGDLVGQVVQRAGDHVGLRGRHLPGRVSGGQDRPAAIQRPRQTPGPDVPDPGRPGPRAGTTPPRPGHRSARPPRRPPPSTATASPSTRDSRRASSTNAAAFSAGDEVEQLDRLGLVQGSGDRLATLLDQVSGRHLHPPLGSELRRRSRAVPAARSQSTRTPVRTPNGVTFRRRCRRTCRDPPTSRQDMATVSPAGPCRQPVPQCPPRTRSRHDPRCRRTRATVARHSQCRAGDPTGGRTRPSAWTAPDRRSAPALPAQSPAHAVAGLRPAPGEERTESPDRRTQRHSCAVTASRRTVPGQRVPAARTCPVSAGVGEPAFTSGATQDGEGDDRGEGRQGEHQRGEGADHAEHGADGGGDHEGAGGTPTPAQGEEGQDDRDRGPRDHDAAHDEGRGLQQALGDALVGELGLLAQHLLHHRVGRERP